MIGMYLYFISEFQLGDILEAFLYQTERSMKVVADLAYDTKSVMERRGTKQGQSTEEPGWSQARVRD